MSEESEKQALVEEIRHRIQLLVTAAGLSESGKMEVLRGVLGIIEHSKKEQVVE